MDDVLERCPVCAELGHFGCIETLLEQQKFDAIKVREECDRRCGALLSDLLDEVLNGRADLWKQIDREIAMSSHALVSFQRHEWKGLWGVDQSKLARLIADLASNEVRIAVRRIFTGARFDELPR